MKIAVIGAGLMGRAVAWDLARSEGVKHVLLLDNDTERLESAAAFAGDVETRICDAGDLVSVADAIAGSDAAVSCVPYRFNVGLTSACIDGGVHFCDLGGNNSVVDAQFDMLERAKENDVAVVPDCGLAPGMASIWAMAGVEALDEVERVSIRCGGLPVEPLPPLNYMKLFSTTGLINEYVEPCRIISDGVEVTVDGLSGLEDISFPEPFGELEAFYTSGGTSTLVGTLRGRVRELDYKTIRYLGHCRLMRAMVAIGLADSGPLTVGGQPVSPRRTLEALLDRHLPSTGLDVTLLRVDCAGQLEDRPATVRYQLIDYADSENGLSSMQRCTGFPAAAVARMLADGTIGERGTLTQELVVPAARLAAELAARGVEIKRAVLRPGEA